MPEMHANIKYWYDNQTSVFSITLYAADFQIKMWRLSSPCAQSPRHERKQSGKLHVRVAVPLRDSHRSTKDEAKRAPQSVRTR
jgi:hypothetical protein